MSFRETMSFRKTIKKAVESCKDDEENPLALHVYETVRDIWLLINIVEELFKEGKYDKGREFLMEAYIKNSRYLYMTQKISTENVKNNCHKRAVELRNIVLLQQQESYDLLKLRIKKKYQKCIKGYQGLDFKLYYMFTTALANDIKCKTIDKDENDLVFLNEAREYFWSKLNKEQRNDIINENEQRKANKNFIKENKRVTSDMIYERRITYKTTHNL